MVVNQNNVAFLVKGDVLSGKYTAYFTTEDGKIKVVEFRDFVEYSSKIINKEDM